MSRTGLSVFKAVASQTKSRHSEYKMPVISLQLPEFIANSLADIAKTTGRSESDLALAALREYLSREVREIAQIEHALKEADAGDFATSQEVKDLVAKWDKAI